MKACEGCTLCCTIFAIPGLKERWEKCRYQTKEGCSNYENRPEHCRIFSCLWQQNYNFRKPSSAGYFIAFNVTTKTLDVQNDPAAPDKWKKDKKKLEKLGKEFPVILVEKDKASPIGEKAKSIKFEE